MSNDLNDRSGRRASGCARDATGQKGPARFSPPERGFLFRHSGAMRSIEPGISRFPGAQFAHLRFGSASRPGMTARVFIVHDFAFSRRDFRPSSASRCPSLERRAQGKPGADRTRSLACKMKKHTSVVTTGSARTTRLSPRNGLTAYSVIFPVSGLGCHRRLADTSAKLSASIAAPEPHDFAVRPGVSSGEIIRLTPKRPSHPAPNVS